jgi:2-polyprenyl-3-methyl-5-hydroxy-6-metoxy-1,4-benzoquinol methylase
MLAYLPEVPPAGAEGWRVLEVGCGEGAFAASLAGATEKWGIEPNATAAGIASERLDRVLTGRFDEVSAQLPERYFDLVICNDVIEHMPDHDRFLRDIQHHIADGGALVGSVPNIRNYKVLFDLLFLGDWRYQDSGIMDRTHLRFFTRHSLRRSLTDAGYHIDMLTGLNGSLSPGRAKWAWPRFLFGCLWIGITMGTARDIIPAQFGFRALTRLTPGYGSYNLGSTGSLNL